MKEHLSPHLVESPHEIFIPLFLIFHSFHRFIELFAPVRIMYIGKGFFTDAIVEVSASVGAVPSFVPLPPSLASCAAFSGTPCCAPLEPHFLRPPAFRSGVQDFPSLM